MKKSNIIIVALLLILSIFLLWLWYFLGFNKVDNPLDLGLSIGWWVILVAAIAAISAAESARRKAVRTVLVAPAKVFNSEKGMAGYQGAAADAVKGILEGLEYGFDKAELPQEAKGLFTYAVKSATFKGSEGQWQGEVVVLQTGETKSFASEAELRAILGA